MQWELLILRRKSELNQKDMAKLLGISTDAYGMKERGEMQFKMNEIFAISDYFNKTVEEIFLKRNFGINEIKEVK